MIGPRAVWLALLLGVLLFLVMRAPGVWLYDAIAHRLRGRRATPPPAGPRQAGKAVARRAGQARQPG
ncbi:MAG: hypothetical protein ACN6O8_10725 [Achromobacter sp.]|uniref:hypothetical protein n=1 Tax=Achromobacter sp. TaxID=134375 RepID=UPI003CFDDBD5